MQTEENPLNIFNLLKNAIEVGGLSTSMQAPNFDEEVVARALNGSAAPSEVVLWLHTGEDPEEITVGQMQAAQQKDSYSWELPEGETLWIIPKPKK